MKPGWTAGVTRARLLVGRAIGPGHASAVAGCPSLAHGLAALAGSAYGERVRAGQNLAAAQRAVADTLLWHLRILAGWLPSAGAALIRALAAWFELVNIDARLAALSSDGHEPEPFVLGALATAWRDTERAHSVEAVADAMASSAWGAPQGRSIQELALGLRVAWGRRVHEAAPAAADWVAGAGALLLARELLVAGSSEHAPQLQLYPGVDRRALDAKTLPELRAALGPRAAWPLSGIVEPTELWQAELGWWDRVEADARTLLRRIDDEVVVLAAVALLAADAQRTARALQSAAQPAAAPTTGVRRGVHGERFDALG